MSSYVHFRCSPRTFRWMFTFRWGAIFYANRITERIMITVIEKRRTHTRSRCVAFENCQNVNQAVVYSIRWWHDRHALHRLHISMAMKRFVLFPCFIVSPTQSEQISFISKRILFILMGFVGGCYFIYIFEIGNHLLFGCVDSLLLGDRKCCSS